jgi:hypothetical protein
MTEKPVYELRLIEREDDRRTTVVLTKGRTFLREMVVVRGV